MTRGSNIARHVIAFFCSAFLVYLTWIGARYVFTRNVVFDVVDGFGVTTIAWFVTKEVIAIDNKLNLNAQFSKQHV